MRAYQISKSGGEPALVDIAVPAPAAGEVLIRIAACGLNFADLLIAKGKYQDMPPFPATLGLELAGTVAALGEGVTGLAAGDRVAVYAGHGGLAEWGCFPAARCLPVPDAMTMTEAAGFQIAYGTSHLALDHAARLKPGETLLVTGAAGGVGLTAVELGRLMGARVIACARGAQKLEAARAAGAHEVIDSDHPDLRGALKAMGGAEVVYDTIGGPLFRPCLSACRPGGRYLLIGFAGGEVQQIPANHLLVKNISVIGLYWGGYLAFDPATLTGSLAQLMDWHAAGKLRPHVSHVMPLADVAEAMEILRARRSTGKIVITM
ncbi:NADPH:quinone oxidoreductase family protein [Mangrovicoccus algicola]|uniref:NADPH:quinone oxidoreductase family protein n=1 Tax=Mangrovicoccus algicola TaxID=2771008 RepID=A0A8J6Z6F3_9RHOB|nr:NADPH:quinone oxidoreductase family protein [Mangrovicoccus algicola]MBE3638679.1 NADPH:quinone oxidoreductase family protein [Mangrovicoccus algicola]